MPPRLRQVEGRGGGDALIGGDVARQAPRRVAPVVGRADGERVAQGSAPDGVGERLLRLEAQAVARGTIQTTRSTTPAATSRAAATTGSSDLPPPGVTAARTSRVSSCPAAMASTMRTSRS